MAAHVRVRLREGIAWVAGLNLQESARRSRANLRPILNWAQPVAATWPNPALGQPALPATQRMVEGKPRRCLRPLLRLQVGAVSLASGLVLEAHELADLIEEFQLGVGNEPCNRR